MQNAAKRVLLVEDDPAIVDLVEIHLSDLSCQVDRAYDGDAGLSMATENEYDLLILDIMLPGRDGLEVCRAFRRDNKYTPVLMLTARAEELDKVLGLEFGADDYLTKPFSVRELIARVKAIFRRQEVNLAHDDALTAEMQISFGDLFIDLRRRVVTLDGSRLELTAKEFELLSLFASHPGQTFTRKKLLETVWGYQFEGYDHTVNSHINRLRNKIEADPANPQLIRTLWGVGYRFMDTAELPQ